MNRGRRMKAFVVGGVYDPSCPHVPQNNQANNQVPSQTPSKPKPLAQSVQQQKLKPQPKQPNSQLPPQQVQQPAPTVNQSQQQQQEVNTQQSTVSTESDNIVNSKNSETIAPMETENNPNDGIPKSLNDRKTFFKKMFADRKKSSLRAKEKKIRQNRNLRKIILPKNALMALNEVKGVQMGDFIVNSIGIGASGGFSALVTVNNIQYEGRGLSKALAKNNACEKALRDIVIAKMQQKPFSLRSSSRNSVEQMDTSESVANESIATDNTDESKEQSNEDDNEIPMVNLASFALFKLFSEWESDGFHIPEFHNSSAGAAGGEKQNASTVKLPKKVTNKTELPPNWETLHPATLLCMMRPGLTYCNWGTDGEGPNQIQSLSVSVDNEIFVGSGRSKKIARKNAAIAACNKLFGTNFVKEENQVSLGF